MECWLSKPPHVFRAPKVEALSANYYQGKKKYLFGLNITMTGEWRERGDEAEIVFFVKNDRQ